jgi:hypothetical protein
MQRKICVREQAVPRLQLGLFFSVRADHRRHSTMLGSSLSVFLKSYRFVAHSARSSSERTAGNCGSAFRAARSSRPAPSAPVAPQEPGLDGNVPRRMPAANGVPFERATLHVDTWHEGRYDQQFLGVRRPSLKRRRRLEVLDGLIGMMEAKLAQGQVEMRLGVSGRPLRRRGLGTPAVSQPNGDSYAMFREGGCLVDSSGAIVEVVHRSIGTDVGAWIPFGRPSVTWKRWEPLFMEILLRHAPLAMPYLAHKGDFAVQRSRHKCSHATS